MKKLIILLLIPFYVEGQDSTSYRYSAEEGWIKTTYSKWWELKPNGDTTYYTEETEITHQDNPYIKMDSSVKFVKSGAQMYNSIRTNYRPTHYVHDTIALNTTNTKIKWKNNTHSEYIWYVDKPEKKKKPKFREIEPETIKSILYKKRLWIISNSKYLVVVEAKTKKAALKRLKIKAAHIYELTDYSIIR